MRFATFTAIIDLPEGTRTPVKISPAHVVGIASPMGANGPLLDRCEVLVSGGMFHVLGSVDEITAALEAATVPPAPAPVVVEPSDLERATKVLDEVARVALTGEVSFEPDVGAIDRALGLDSPRWDETSDALTALANRLRGTAR